MLTLDTLDPSPALSSSSQEVENARLKIDLDTVDKRRGSEQQS